MKPEHSRLSQQQIEQKQTVTEQIQSQAGGQEFASVEDLLRHDCDQNPVSPEVGERLNASIAAEPKPAKPWYRNLFGK